MNPEVGPLCPRRLDVHQVYAVQEYVQQSHTNKTYSHRWRQKSVICHQSTLSRHHSSRAWRCRDVSCSLARGTRHLSPASSRLFPMVLDNTAGVTCAWISPLNLIRVATAAHTMRRSWRASVLRGRPEPGLRVWECYTDHCSKQLNTADTLCPTCAAIQLPAALQCDPVQMAEVVQQEHLFDSGHGYTLEWMFQALFTYQSTTVTACRVKTEGAWTGLSATWSPMTVTNESLTLQSSRMVDFSCSVFWLIVHSFGKMCSYFFIYF